jgi:hypothetical protein
VLTADNELGWTISMGKLARLVESWLETPLGTSDGVAA